MYTIIDLIDRLIEIEEEEYKLYLRIFENVNLENRLQIIAKIFMNEEKKHLRIYEQLKVNSNTYENIEVEVGTYDRASQLIFEFFKIRTNYKITDIKELLEAALIFEEENLALVLIISGLFVKVYNDVETANYKILSEIIKEEQNHVKVVEDIIKRSSIYK